MRLCRLFVLPCLAVLVPGGALATLLSAAAATAVLVPGGAFGQQHEQQAAAAVYYLSSILSHQFPQVFNSSRVAEVTLGTFSVRFCGLFVLQCLAALVPGGAFGTLLSAAAAAAAAV